MDIKLKDGDFDRDERGLPVSITGNEELLQRCLIRLSVPRGRFILNGDLGSEIKSLLKAKPAELDARAYQLVAGALEPVKEVRVESVETRRDMAGHLDITVYLGLRGTRETLNITV
ncbi:MAG TPA: histidine kinase [Ruminococcaceae bacterium]|nr:histidine kinase [Oscillospiraceae bacterium]